MLEALFGGGYQSPPANNNTNTQPTTSPSQPSEPATGTTQPEEDETVEDGMPADYDDGTYSPAPVTDDNSAEETTAEQPSDEPAVSEPVASEEATATPAPAPVATAPAEEEDEEADSESPAATEPAVSAPSQPAPAPTPSNDNSAEPQPSEDIATDTTVTTAVATKPDPVARITDLIASYEKLLSEPEVDENEQARTRAMELAQNRTLTSLLDSLSSADARAVQTSLDDDTGKDQVSLITKYYAEAGR